MNMGIILFICRKNNMQEIPGLTLPLPLPLSHDVLV